MNKSMIRSGSTILLFFLILSLFNSCKKNDPDPDYVGTWSMVDTVTDGDQTLQVKDAMTFTRDNFSDKYQIYDEAASKFVDYLVLRGNLSASDHIMNCTINELGVSSFDMITGKPTGVVTYYKDGSTEFQTLFAQISQPKTFSIDYSISGNNMTIRSDNNGDGDYADAGELLVYTRE